MPTRIFVPEEQAPLQENNFKRLCKWLLKNVFLLICAFSSAYLLYISFPKKSCALAAWLALAPFVWGVTHIKRIFWAFCYGWLSGFLFCAASLYWVYYTCVHGGGLSSDVALGAWLGLALVVSLPFAIWGASCTVLKKLGVFFPFLAACAWVTLEWLHQQIALFGIGFPWLMLGYTQWNLPQTLQLAGFTGFYGLSFALAFTGVSVGWAFSLSSLKKSIGHMLLAGAVFVGVYSLGEMQLDESHTRLKDGEKLRVALLQPNIDQYKKWDADFVDEINGTLLEMGQHLPAGVDLAVWPESVLPEDFTQPLYTAMFDAFSAESGAYQVIGSNITEGKKNYVGAYVVSPNDDEELQSYRKIKLVPFGEFIPFEKWLLRYFPNVEVLGALGAFDAGPRFQAPLAVGDMKLGINICFESVFPQLWHEQSKQGAQVFVNITNDAWYFDTDAPYQHLAINVLRAVETGRPLLRAANTGFSAYIDPYGRIVRHTGLFTRETLKTKIPVWSSEEQNFYTRWGDWFAWLCVVFYFTMVMSTLALSDD